MRADQRSRVQAQKRAWSRGNQTVCALRVLDRVTLGQDGRITHLPCPRAETKRPIGLSQPEGAPCCAALPHLQDRTVLMTADAAGLRLSAARHWPIAASDAQRLVMRVRQGNGHQDRDLRRSPKLLAR
jgi:hypothetical protein